MAPVDRLPGLCPGASGESATEVRSVQAGAILIDTALSAWHRAQFSWTDVLRCAQGDAFEAFGLGPAECPYRVLASGPHWRLRDYADQDTSPSILIVAAPIKRPYIWDLAPSVSAIRYCMRNRLHVYLLEWMPASRGIANNGLDEYGQAISECIAEITAEPRGATPFLVGHSLGGTLAAIFAASAPRAPWSTALFPAGNKSFPGRSRLTGSVGTVGNRPLSGLATIAHERPSIARYVHMVEADGRRFQHRRLSRARHPWSGGALGARRGSASGQIGSPDRGVALPRKSLLSRNPEGR